MRSFISGVISFGSNEEISECLSEKSFFIYSSVYFDRLLEFKFFIELMKSKECSDVEYE